MVQRIREKPLNKRLYSTKCNPFNSPTEVVGEKVYSNADTCKALILADNKGKSGIYMFTNKVTKDFYIGQSKNLYNRFLNYFNLSYIKRLGPSRIGRAIIKYGYSKFSVTILEYCDKCDLDIREQHYFDTLNPKYNIQKIAGGSSKGLILSEETKNKISKALKGIYVGEKAY